MELGRAALAIFVATLMGLSSPAFAETDPNDNQRDSKKSEDVREKYIEKLETRIRSLEKKEERLQRLEKKIDILTSKLAAPHSGKRWHGPVVTGRGISPATEQTTPLSLTPSADPQTEFNPQPNSTAAATPIALADQAPQPNSTPAATPPAPADQAPQPNSTAAATPPALADQEDVDALRDLTVIRDEAVTTKQGTYDLSFNMKYIRDTTDLQFSRAFVGTFIARYGVLQGLEVSLTVPGYEATRSTQVSPTSSYTTNIWEPGDISAQVTGTLYKESLNAPAIFGYGAITAPTGPNPYWVPAGQTIQAEPINPLYFTNSLGQWGGTVGFTAAKSIEPIIVFGGVNYTHWLSRSLYGATLEPGDRYGYSLGLGLAVSERTMLGFAVQGFYQSDLIMNGRAVTGVGSAATSAEPVLLTLSLSQRIALGLFIEPGVTIGMTADAPQATVTINVRKIFGGP